MQKISQACSLGGIRTHDTCNMWLLTVVGGSAVEDVARVGLTAGGEPAGGPGGPGGPG